MRGREKREGEGESIAERVGDSGQEIVRKDEIGERK